MACGDRSQRGVLSDAADPLGFAERARREERDAEASARFRHAGLESGGVVHAELHLDVGDGRDREGLFELLDGDVGEAERSHAAGRAQLVERAHAGGERSLRVDDVEEVHVERLATEREEAAFAGGFEVLLLAVREPALLRADEAALGRDDHVRGVTGVRLECGADEAFVVADVALGRAVDVGGVQPSHARVEGGVDDGDAVGVGQVHAAEAGTPHGSSGRRDRSRIANAGS